MIEVTYEDYPEFLRYEIQRIHEKRHLSTNSTWKILSVIFGVLWMDTRAIKH